MAASNKDAVFLLPPKWGNLKGAARLNYRLKILLDQPEYNVRLWLSDQKLCNPADEGRLPERMEKIRQGLVLETEIRSNSKEEVYIRHESTC